MCLGAEKVENHCLRPKREPPSLQLPSGFHVMLTLLIYSSMGPCGQRVLRCVNGFSEAPSTANMAAHSNSPDNGNSNRTNNFARSCSVCNSQLHASNKKRICLICKRHAHWLCAPVSDGIYYCMICLNQSLPFLHIENEDEYFEQFGLSQYTLKNNLNYYKNCYLNLDMCYGIEDTSIVDPDLEAGHNLFNLNNVNDYFDTVQFNLHLDNLNNNQIDLLMHINVNRILNKLDTLQTELESLKRKVSILAVTETWTTKLTESQILLPGYDCIIKSRDGTKMGGGHLH